jgi:nitrite reductase (NADH) small subunit
MPARRAVRSVTLGPAEAIPLGEGRAFVVGGEEVAVFRTRSGRLFATQASCPHARGPLADGLTSATTVICPLHAFAFDLASGRCLSSVSCADLRVYQVALAADGQILLQLPKRPGAKRSANRERAGRDGDAARSALDAEGGTAA